MSRTRLASRLEQIAADCYDRVARRNHGRFDIEDVRDEVAAAFFALDSPDDFVYEAVNSVTDKVDKARSTATDVAQLDLFSGEMAALDVVWKLGGGQRVVRRYATRADWYDREGLKKENIDNAKRTLKREQDEMAKLLPYMVNDTVTHEQALVMWRVANP